MKLTAEKTDRAGYDDLYKENLSDLCAVSGCNDYIKAYESTRIGPYYKSGNTKGYVRGEALRRMVSDADRLGIQRAEINVLDAGSGQGELSVYLACLGFNVTGIDISSEAKTCGEYLAAKVGVARDVTSTPKAWSMVSVGDASMHFVIGHASLHHFVKYEDVPGELRRVLKEQGKGYFSDSFGENRIYHVFHDKEQDGEAGRCYPDKKSD